ncbi:MAG: GNAT family N-acetyltransferase [Parvularculales bacterium]
MKSGLRIIPFKRTDRDFQILYQLEKSLDYHVKNFGSPEMLKYEASLIPEKCNPKTEFLEVDNKIIGYGFTGHQSWAFDKTLLDSSLSFPCEEKYLKYAQEYLEHQIANARKIKGVKTFRAWLWQGNKFKTDFYIKNGFEISLVEFVSIISLADFREEEFSDHINRFNKNSFKIRTLKELQKDNPQWTEKLYDLWHRVDLDVPADFKVDDNREHWKTHNITPWFKPEDFYIVIDGTKWVALSTYNRGDTISDTVSTELTGVLPEYRRKSICTALKVYALVDLRKKGFKKVFTENEENNPMYKINLMLGFKKIGAEAGCKLAL